MSEKTTIDELRKMLQFISRGYDIPKEIYDVIFKVAKIEIEDKKRVILLKRDPNIHRDRITGSYVKITEGNIIKIHPLSVGGFGADFDGDQMAVYTPLSEEAQDEIKSKMLSSFGNESINKTNFELSKEMLLGLYTMTYVVLNKPVIKVTGLDQLENLHIGQKIISTFKNLKEETTVGRLLVNTTFPDYVPYMNEPLGKKELNSILSKIMAHNENDFKITVDKLCKMGFLYATLYPQTISLDEFVMPDNILKLIEKYKKEEDVYKKDLLLKEIDKALLEHFKKHAPSLYVHVMSGSTKGIGQIRQVLAIKGLITDPSGKVISIDQSISEGFNADNYFMAANGSRKGTADRALNTAYGGYTYRKMVFCIGDAELNPDLGDCGTQRGLKLKMTNEIFKRMQGRYKLENRKIMPITEQDKGKIIEIRSPVFCKSKKVCKVCYGDLLYQSNSNNIGITAVQEVASLSERIMKCSDGFLHVDNKLIPYKELWDNIANS